MQPLRLIDVQKKGGLPLNGDALFVRLEDFPVLKCFIHHACLISEIPFTKLRNLNGKNPKVALFNPCA
jgi:hypothetical protein